MLPSIDAETPKQVILGENLGHRIWVIRPLYQNKSVYHAGNYNIIMSRPLLNGIPREQSWKRSGEWGSPFCSSADWLSPSRFAGKAIGMQSFQVVCEYHSSSIIMFETRADEGLCSSNMTHRQTFRCWSVYRLWPAWDVHQLSKRLSVLYRENLT